MRVMVTRVRISLLLGSVALVCLPSQAPAAASRAADAVVLPAAPTNDSYLRSWVIRAAASAPRFRSVRELSQDVGEDTSAASTQAGDIFSVDRAGRPFAGGGPEPLTCAGGRYGKTVWFDLHPTVPMGLQLVASGYPNSIAVFEYDVRTAQLDRQSVFCQRSATASNMVNLPAELHRGLAYTVQVGGLQTGDGFGGGSLALSVHMFPDHDADQVPDGIDNCPFLEGVVGGCPPVLAPRPHFQYSAFPSKVRISGLVVDNIPGGARVEARCGKCRVREVAIAGPRAHSISMPSFAGVELQQGWRVEFWVSKGPVRGKAGRSSKYRYGAVGSYISYSVTTGTLKASVTRCLLPGSLTPRRQCL